MTDTANSISAKLSWFERGGFGHVWDSIISSMEIGHGAVNATSALAGYLLKGPAMPMLGPAPTGLIGGLGYLILALALLFSRTEFTGRISRQGETVSQSLVSR